MEEIDRTDSHLRHVLKDKRIQVRGREFHRIGVESDHPAKRAVALDPHMSDALNLLSALSLRDGHPEQAIDYSQKALSFNPDDQQALYHLMLALRKAGHTDEVPAVLQRFTAAPKAQSLVQKKRYKLDEVPQPLSVSEP